MCLKEAIHGSDELCPSRWDRAVDYEFNLMNQQHILNKMSLKQSTQEIRLSVWFMTLFQPEAHRN